MSRSKPPVLSNSMKPPAPGAISLITMSEGAHPTVKTKASSHTGAFCSPLRESQVFWSHAFVPSTRYRPTLPAAAPLTPPVQTWYAPESEDRVKATVTVVVLPCQRSLTTADCTDPPGFDGIAEHGSAAMTVKAIASPAAGSRGRCGTSRTKRTPSPQFGASGVGIMPLRTTPPSGFLPYASLAGTDAYWRESSGTFRPPHGQSSGFQRYTWPPVGL